MAAIVAELLHGEHAGWHRHFSGGLLAHGWQSGLIGTVMPIRGIIAADLIGKWGVYPVQVLDGISAGLQSVAVPGLAGRIPDSTGRVSVGQGAVSTAQGLGASLSPAIGGWIAQEIGFSAMFLILGSFALGSVALWLGFASVLRPACACMIIPAIDGWPHRRVRSDA